MDHRAVTSTDLVRAYEANPRTSKAIASRLQELLLRKTPVMNRGMTIKGKSAMDDYDRPFTSTDLIYVYRVYPQVSKRVAQRVSAVLLDCPEFPTLWDLIGILRKELALAAFNVGEHGSC